ncbi:hypothetical protein [Wolbachia endosymbiont (group E) of Neria commutata]|uniref:hypothetical protein n=1 Tax=Wolbachia endosymbiont (group E) of Neria commutata TaxID=3066149 RepID=UPI00313344DC
MAISYAKVSKTQYIFRQLTGLTTSEFEKIVAKVRPEWEKEERQDPLRNNVKQVADKIW